MNEHEEQTDWLERGYKVFGIGTHLLFNFTLPLLTTIYDFIWGSNQIKKEKKVKAKKVDAKAVKAIRNHIEIPAMTGAFIGAGFGMGLCHPDGILDALGCTDLPITNLHDVFGDIIKGNDIHDNYLHLFVYLLTIAFCTIFFKAIFAEAGNQHLRSKLNEKGKKSMGAGYGLAYGFFGDSFFELVQLHKGSSPSKKAPVPNNLKEENKQLLSQEVIPDELSDAKQNPDELPNPIPVEGFQSAVEKGPIEDPEIDSKNSADHNPPEKKVYSRKENRHNKVHPYNDYCPEIPPDKDPDSKLDEAMQGEYGRAFHTFKRK